MAQRSGSGWHISDLGMVSVGPDVARAINNRGQTVGGTLDQHNGAIQAFVAAEGTVQLLGTLGGSFSVAFDINNRGEIVGASLTEGDVSSHAFLRGESGLVDLNETLPANSEWELMQAFGINDYGQIIGVGQLRGQDHIFLLTPTNSGRRDRPTEDKDELS